MPKRNVEILECSNCCSGRIWMYLIAHGIFVHVFITSPVSTLMEHHLIIHSVSLVHYLWCGDSVRKNLKVKYFPFCLLWQNLTELPFLETKEVPVWFLLGASDLHFWVLYRFHYLWKQHLEHEVLQMAHQQGACISFRAGENESEGELPLCWLSFGVLPVLRNSLLNLSCSSPAP